MATLVPSLFEINGVVDTNNDVLRNIQTMCQASGAWLTYDIEQGKWAVVVNKAGSPSGYFNNSNIIGGINVSSTGITEMYNAVEVEYPNADIEDKVDYIRFEIPAEQRFPNEPDNTLTLSFDVFNSQIQAEQIGAQELKQSRLDKVIEFRTDYSMFGLKAGDIIAVTAEPYGFNQKQFRITKLVEEDTDDGTIQLAITALEYDPSIYDTSNLIRTERNRLTGIVQKGSNQTLLGKDLANKNTMVFAFLNPQIIFIETLETNWLKNGFGMRQPFNTYPTGYAFKVPVNGMYKIRYFANWGGNEIEPAPGSGDLYATPQNVMKAIQIAIKVNGVFVYLDNTITGDQRVQLMEDHTMEDMIRLYAGQVVEFYVCAKCTYGPNHPFAAGLDVKSFVRLSGEVYYIST